MKAKLFIIFGLVILAIISLVIWQLVYQSFSNRTTNNTKNANYSNDLSKISFTYPENWKVNEGNFRQGNDIDPTNSYSIDITSNNYLKINMLLEDNTAKPLSPEEAARLSEVRKEIVPSFDEEQFYIRNHYDPSKYVEIATIDGVKLVRESIETAKIEQGAIRGFTVFAVDGEDITHQLRILGRSQNTDRINISYLIDPAIGADNIPSDLEATLKQADDIVRSLKLK